MDRRRRRPRAARRQYRQRLASLLYVAEDRKQSSLDGFWETLSPEQISGIGAGAMDMWDGYIASVRAHVPEADGKIVFDKFHAGCGGRRTMP